MPNPQPLSNIGVYHMNNEFNLDDIKEIDIDDLEETPELPSANNTSESSISLNDLMQAVNIIDIAAKNGSFQGPDLEVIGATRNRIANFINANQSLLNANQQTSSTEVPPGPPEEVANEPVDIPSNLG